MNTTKQLRRNRLATRVAVVATVPCAVVAVLAGAALADGNLRVSPDGQGGRAAGGNEAVAPVPEIPIWVQARDRVRMCQLAAELPQNWPAAEVLRRAAEHPLGDAFQRAEWRRDAELMPASWPATQVLLADAERRWDCSFVS